MINEINKSLEPYTEQIINHSLYDKISTPEQLNCFLEHHVFAVWDFMSLLKSLQEKFTKTSSPWFPVGDPEIRYLINEIVLDEETDLNYHGKRQSHFEMYLDAMEKSGANRKRINDFLNQVTHGTDIFLVIATSDLPVSIKQFLKFTFEIISEGKPHKIAAAFTFGREGIVPGMFSSIISNIQSKFPEENLTIIKYYFDRHIDLYAEKHGPMANKIIEELCGSNSRKWDDVKEVSLRCLQSRIKLWNGIEEEISQEIPA